MHTSFAFSILVLAYCAVSVPVPTPKIPSKEMVGFMKKFGYIVDAGPDTDALYTEEGFKEAIRVMQRYGGLPETGDMDQDTLQLMTAPRCGVPDVIRKPNEVSGNRTKRYVIGAPGWRKRTLTYFLANWPPELDPDTTLAKLKNAFQLWSNITPLKFAHKRSMDADLIIAFGRGPHGDGYPFDGRGSILAHAFFPYEHGVYGGDVHFDDDEHWIDGSAVSTVQAEDGVDFFTVATHEIGHSLGLAHSTVSGSIMFPYYKGYNKHMRLDYDDIVAMYEMYVMRGAFEDDDNVAVVPDEPATDDANTESDDVDDDVYSDGEDGKEGEDRRDDYVPADDGTTEVPDAGNDEETSNDDGGEVDDEDIDETQDEEPRKDDGDHPSEDEGDEEVEDEKTNNDDRSQDDDSEDESKKPEVKGTDDDKVAKPRTPPDICEGSFNAASLIRGELFIFKGLYMWRLKDIGQVMSGYPVYFHVFFRGLPWTVRNIDAVYQRPQDYSIIFFTGPQFWVFDGNSFAANSPQPLTDLGLPDDLDRIDAAIVWAKNGKTYLFSGALYWKYDEIKGRVEHGYPQRIYRWKGVPDTADSAFTWKDGQTYFFKGTQYWRFNNQNISTDADYPQPTAPHWLGC